MVAGAESVVPAGCQAPPNSGCNVEPDQNGTQPLGILRALLELEQRDDLGPDQSLVESAGLPDRDALDIQPVLGPAGKCLEHDQVFRAARPEDGTEGDLEVRGPLDGVLFERIAPSAMSRGTPADERIKTTRF